MYCAFRATFSGSLCSQVLSLAIGAAIVTCPGRPVAAEERDAETNTREPDNVAGPPPADSDDATDEAPIDLQLPAASSDEKLPEDEELALPSPEILAKLPLFVTAVSKTTFTLQNPQYRYRMDKWMPETFLGLLFLGRVHRHLAVAAGIFGMATPQVLKAPDLSTGKFLDFLAALQIEPAKWFNIWVGHVLVPADRSSLSSPFFMTPWRFPGEMTPGALPTGPKTGTFAGISASNGPTVWGELGGGVFKYYAGSYLQDPEGTPLYSCRVNLALINPEPGFLNASGYYGKKGDMLAIGASLQYQSFGSYRVLTDEVTLRSSYVGGNVDFLFEKKLGGHAVLDFEAAAYVYHGDYERVDYSGFALMSLLLPFRVGIGRPQIMARYQTFHQRADGSSPNGSLYHVIDVQISYVIKGDHIKGALGYTRHQNAVHESTGNAIYLGFQLSK